MRAASCLTLCSAAAAAGSIPEFSVKQWKDSITGSACESKTLKAKDGSTTATLECTTDKKGRRHFKFPAGKFDIDEQVEVPEQTTIEGRSNPNKAADKSQKPDESMQTYFIATGGVSDLDVAYCGTSNNMAPGDAKKLRIGFLMNSHTRVVNINFQGKDTIRPLDNGNLCGGGVFETPGCVSPGFGDGVGTDWISKRNGCYDHTGKKNNLILGHGKGVEDVVIEDVRLNDLFLPEPDQYEKKGQGSQLAVWVAQTQDGSATKNVHVRNLVGMLFRGDGINFHGNVQDSTVKDCHIENTGDDIYAFWGGYGKNPSGIVFANNVGKNPGVTRNYEYGVCVAVYGGHDIEVSGTKCYDRMQSDWNPDQFPSGDGACQNGPFCNSCIAYVHDGWFGAVYPSGNSIKLHGNEYFDAAGKRIPSSDRPKYRMDSKSAANVKSDEKPVVPSPSPPGPSPGPPVNGTWKLLGEGCCHDLPSVSSDMKIYDGAGSGDDNGCKAKCQTFGESCGFAVAFPDGGWCTVLKPQVVCDTLDAKQGDCGSSGAGVHSYKFTAATVLI